VKARQTSLVVWLLQRASVVYMLVFVLLSLGLFSLYPPRSSTEWRSLVARPGVTVAALAFFGALLLHLWIGLHEVLRDWVRPSAPRALLSFALRAAILGMAVWVFRVLLRLQE
jgi:succinate dehydrogenase / fumarate reductase, membrane anchor subunit